MKLTVIGAGSSRLPLMLASAAVASRDGWLQEIALFDTRRDRIDALLPVGHALSAECGPLPRVSVHDSAKAALDGASAVVLTVRPGLEEARARDERACLDLGVIGQETTGPAGFAFAARSIPVAIQYCRLAEKTSPGCLPVVFTNPAGMVTQALHCQGIESAVGVCDSASVAASSIVARVGAEQASDDYEVYGLNHLSWTSSVKAGDLDLLARALKDDRFLKEAFPWFPPGQLRSMGRVPNEYLFYYYRAEEALSALLSEPVSRGEALAKCNQSMFRDVGETTDRGEVKKALVRYAEYLRGRNDTYMEYARSGPVPVQSIRSPGEAIEALKGFVGGYAEVAMDLIAALKLHRPLRMALNVANQGAIPGLMPDDVVETDCDVGEDGIVPRVHTDIHAQDAELIGRVKEYERLAIRSILEHSPVLAEDALAAHPLVPSRDKARELVGALGCWD